MIYYSRDNYYGKDKIFEYEISPDETLRLKKIPENISDYYPINYHCHQTNHNETRNSVIINRAKYFLNKLLFLFKVRSVSSFDYVLKNLNMSSNHRILDVGCGGGKLLFNLREKGFINLTGVDPFLPDELISNNKITFLKKSIFEIEGEYDRIILDHVIEHMVEHHLVIKKLYNLLTPNGKLLIRTPIFKSEAWHLYKENWFQLDAPRHLIIHSEKSLINLASDNFFNLEWLFYDSNFFQFARSEIYKKNISSIDFLNKYNGDFNLFFSKRKIEYWKKRSISLNREKKGDQAAFIFNRIEKIT